MNKICFKQLNIDEPARNHAKNRKRGPQKIVKQSVKVRNC